MQMLGILTRWRGPVITGLPVSRGDLDYWRPDNIPVNVSIDEWLLRDKNSGDRRTMICNALFEAIRQLKDRL